MTKPRQLSRRVLHLFLLVSALAFPTWAQDQGRTASLDRVMDQVVIAGVKLPNVRTRPIAQLRLLAFREGRPAPIPFQIDERTPAGEYVMTRPAGVQDRDDGRLDDNDELVFMARDAGDRGDPKAGGLSPTGWDEIELTDPLTGKRAYAYLAFFPSDPPPLSPVSYMQYRETPGSDELATPYYTLRFPKNNVFIRDIMIHPAAGGNGQDFMDRIKMRLAVKVLAGHWSVDRTEENFVSQVLGVARGPVRVIRQTDTRLKIFLNLKSPSAVVNGSFYPCSFQFPSMLSLPFRMDLVASDAVIRQGWDLNRAALDMKFYSNLNPRPVTYDGKMDPAEVELANNPNTLYWALGTGPPGTFMFKGVWDESSPLRVRLYYEDDLSRLEPPEEDPGVMGFAYQLENLLNIGTGRYPFSIVNYIVPDFNGDVPRALRVFDHPLQITVNP